MTKMYVDYDLINKNPNKYGLKPSDIKKLKILDWEKLKTKTWYNSAKKDSGNWWCKLIGCNVTGNYNDEDEFWIGFNVDNDKIDYHFTSYGGMCGYEFDEFYDGKCIENKYDMQVQANTIHWLNDLLDEKILGV